MNMDNQMAYKKHGYFKNFMFWNFYKFNHNSGYRIYFRNYKSVFLIGLYFNIFGFNVGFKK